MQQAQVLFFPVKFFILFNALQQPSVKLSLVVSIQQTLKVAFSDPIVVVLTQV